jgi:hypothetical protein
MRLFSKPVRVGIIALTCDLRSHSEQESAFVRDVRRGAIPQALGKSRPSLCQLTHGKRGSGLHAVPDGNNLAAWMEAASRSALSIPGSSGCGG